MRRPDPITTTASAPGGKPRTALDRYLLEIANISILTPEEERKLGRAVRAHAEQFRSSLFVIPFTARQLTERWRRIHEEGRVVALLSAHYQSKARDACRARIEAHLLDLERLVRLRRRSRRGNTLSLRELDDRIERLLKEILPVDWVLEGIFRELQRRAASIQRIGRRRRRSRGASARIGELEREVGLDADTFRKRMRELSRSHERLEEARNEFVRRNLRLVVALAKNYREMGVPFMDLIQEGNLGLLRAVEKFDVQRGFRFSSYAVWWIEQAFVRAVQNQSRTVRLPAHVYELQLRRGRLEQDSRARGSQDRDEDLMRGLELEQGALDLLRMASKRAVSLDEPHPTTETSWAERLADPRGSYIGEQLDSERLRRKLETMIEELGDRERTVLIARYGLRGQPVRTLREVGIELGLSHERVRQIEKAGIQQLRERARDGGWLEEEDASQPPSAEVRV